MVVLVLGASSAGCTGAAPEAPAASSGVASTMSDEATSSATQGDDPTERPQPTDEASVRDGTPGAATPSSSPLPVDAGALVEQAVFEISEGRVAGPQSVEVAVGDTIELVVRSDVETTIRAEELDIESSIGASGELVVSVTVKDAGDYRVETGEGSVLTTIRSR